MSGPFNDVWILGAPFIFYTIGWFTGRAVGEMKEGMSLPKITVLALGVVALNIAKACLAVAVP